jgi:hypothetical protein
MGEILSAAQNRLQVWRHEAMFIVVCGEAWTDADWDAHLNNVETLVRTTGAPRAILLFAPLHGPTAKQRSAQQKRDSDLGVSELKVIAMISDSVLARGALTAISWLIPSKAEIRAFKSTATMEALDWLAAREKIDKQQAIAQLAVMTDRAGMKNPIAR